MLVGLLRGDEVDHCYLLVAADDVVHVDQVEPFG